MAKGRIAIIGLGRVGTAIGYLLARAGHEIIAVWDSSPEALHRGRTHTGGKIALDAVDAGREAETVFLTVPDDEIEAVCRAMAKGGAFRPGMKVVHVSGAGSLGLLAAAEACGAETACIHPLQSFADLQGAVENLPGSTFGVTCHEKAQPWVFGLVKDLKGRPFPVPDRDKPLYHAAACIASNYLVTLLYIVEDIYRILGLTGEEALRAFQPLVQGTIRNIEAKGTLEALTGPIARGDVGTIEKHLGAFAGKAPEYLSVYRILGNVTLNIARRRGTITAEKAVLLADKLKGEHHEHTG